MKWRTIEDFPDYQVSTTGKIRVRTRVVEQLSANGNPYYRSIAAQEMTPFNNGIGYLQVNLRRKKRGYKRYVHVLVAKAFVTGWKSGLEVDHKDEDKKNNRARNLEWVTRKENRIRMGLSRRMRVWWNS